MRRLPPPPDSPAQKRLLRATSAADYLPAAALFPLRGSAPFVILFLALGLWWTSTNVFGVYLLGVFCGATLHWLFHVLERGLLGYADPPPLSAFGFLRWDPRPLKFLLLFAVALIVAERLNRELSVEWAVGFLLLWLPFAPAILVTLALEGSLRAALQPGRLLGFMLHGGFVYWVAAAGLGAIFGDFIRDFVAFFAVDLKTFFLAVTVQPIEPAALLTTIGALYTAAGSLHLLGASLWLRREDLNIEAQVEAEHADAPAQAMMVRHVNELFARIDRLVDREEHEAAEREALSFRLDAFDPLTQLELMFEAARERKRNYLVIVTGQRYIEASLAARRPRQALDAAEICLDRYAPFEPFRPAHTVALAAEALESGRDALFARLTRDFDQRHPQALAERAEIAWLRARSLAERAADDAGALEILRTAPTHPDAGTQARISAYREALERCRAGP